MLTASAGQRASGLADRLCAFFIALPEPDDKNAAEIIGRGFFSAGLVDQVEMNVARLAARDAAGQKARDGLAFVLGEQRAGIDGIRTAFGNAHSHYLQSYAEAPVH